MHSNLEITAKFLSKIFFQNEEYGIEVYEVTKSFYEKSKSVSVIDGDSRRAFDAFVP